MNVKDDLMAAFKARLPGVHLRTLEETRALDALRQTIRALNEQTDTGRDVKMWSSSSGLSRLDCSNAEEPLDVVEEELCAFDQMATAFKKLEKPTIQILLDPWDGLSQPANQRHLRECLLVARQAGHTIVLVGKDWSIPVELQAEIFICDLPLPSRGALEEYIQSLVVLYSEKLPGKIKVDKPSVPILASACSGLTLNETKSIVSLSLVRYQAIGKESVRMAIREKSQIVRRTGLLEYEDPDRNMADVGGLKNLKTWLLKRASLFTPEARKAGIRAPKGTLLIGVPGTGKTLCARAIAAAWNQPLIRLDAGKLFGSLVGESEANLRTALRTAEAVSPCVLLLDEIEKGFTKSAGGDGGTSQRVFGALLSWMQDTKAEVFVVGTANVLDKLDSALIRRFDSVFAVDLPDDRARTEILTIYLNRAAIKLNSEELGLCVRESKGFTGSELERAVQNALIEAFNDDRAVVGRDMYEAVKGIVPISKTMGAEIDAIREVCKAGRAMPADGSIEQEAARERRKGPTIDIK